MCCNALHLGLFSINKPLKIISRHCQPLCSTIRVQHVIMLKPYNVNTAHLLTVLHTPNIQTFQRTMTLKLRFQSVHEAQNQ